MSRGLEGLGIWVKMNSRRFNPIMGILNEYWAADTLNMDLNEDAGPDLVRGRLATEVKFAMLKSNRDVVWKALGHQKGWASDPRWDDFYFALGTYTLSLPISEIPLRASIEKMNSLVVERDLWIVDPSWIDQFPAHLHQGPRHKNEIVYLPRSHLPNVVDNMEVNGGHLYFTENTSRNIFGI